LVSLVLRNYYSCLEALEVRSAPPTWVPVAAPPAEEDLAIARAAVNEVLTKGGKHTSLRWENPKTGAHGTVTPLALTYQQSGVTCRDFLTSYVKNGSASWLQGKACHARRGKWEVRNLRPWITPNSPLLSFSPEPHD